MTLLPKPLYGSPCNSCGRCCIAEQCPLSLALFGDLEVCPALAEPDEQGRRVCGVVRDPEVYVASSRWAEPVLSEAFAILIGAGAGCDAVHSDADEAASVTQRPILIARAETAIAKASGPAREVVEFLVERRKP